MTARPASSIVSRALCSPRTVERRGERRALLTAETAAGDALSKAETPLPDDMQALDEYERAA